MGETYLRLFSVSKISTERAGWMSEGLWSLGSSCEEAMLLITNYANLKGFETSLFLGLSPLASSRFLRRLRDQPIPFSSSAQVRSASRLSGACPARQPVDRAPVSHRAHGALSHRRCLPWAMHTECILCEEMCPTLPKAIWHRVVDIVAGDGSVKKLKQPYVDPRLCIGFGICENKCPVEDLAAIHVSSEGETRSESNQVILER